MSFLERLANYQWLLIHIRCNLIITERWTAVKNRCNANPFKRICISYKTEIIEVSVLVGYNKINHNHLIDFINNILNAQKFATVNIMLINRQVIRFRIPLQNFPSCNKFRISWNKIFAHAVWLFVINNNGITDMVYIQFIHNQWRNSLIKRLLFIWQTACFKQATLLINYFPSFL